MPFVIFELILKIVLTSMEGQTPEQKKIMWDWYIKDITWWRSFLKLDQAS